MRIYFESGLIVVYILTSMLRRRFIVPSLGVLFALAAFVYPPSLNYLWTFLRTPYDLFVADAMGLEMLALEKEIWAFYDKEGKFPMEPHVYALMAGMQRFELPQPNTRLKFKTLDPWGKPYCYRRLTRPEGYELSSSGPDGVTGTKDDVIFRRTTANGRDEPQFWKSP